MPHPGNESILVYSSTQQILTNTNLTSGYEISLGSPTKYPIKQKNLESCLALARKKIEEKFGATTDAQFTVQISTEVRVQNVDKFVPYLDFKANGKEDKQKERVKRETFPEFMKRNPHFFSE